ncbi:MAG: 4-hydroxy-tetrahydrodipicolinate synthase [Elusimicrobia bacterium]|nr:4-hydroxy-tetrahydrodipicolinate synthase [Elusimicrobiota bacterium]
MFKGSCVALVTPFSNGSVDYDAIKNLVEWHIEKGTSCIVPCGCTGEAATLDHDEHKKIIKTVIKEAAGRVQVMPGTGSNSTAEAVELTDFAKKAGADGALIISPYYNKPTQEGLYRHYKKIAESVDIPICLYNVPSRTGKNVEPETVKRLSEIDNIVAIKEASGDVGQCAEIVRLCGDNIVLLSGDDSLTYPIMALGGKGVVSVLANIVPGVVANLTGSFLEGKIHESLRLHYKWLPLMDALFIETNPGPVKEALAMMGKIKPELRLPLVNLSEINRQKLRKVIQDLNLEIV